MRYLAFALLVLSAPLAAQEQLGAFTYHHALDAITDEDRSAVATPALEAGPMADIYFALGCYGSEMRALVNLSDYMVSERAQVVWRVDREPPIGPTAWYVHEGRMVVAFDAAARGLAQNVVSGDTLAFRVEVSDRSVRTYTFSLEGAPEALDRLLCWPSPT